MQAFFAGLALGFAVILFAMEGKKEGTAAEANTMEKKTAAAFPALAPVQQPPTNNYYRGCGEIDRTRLLDTQSPGPAAPSMYPAASSKVM
jgi:hypothetical protein